MNDIIFQLGPFTIYTLGLSLAVSYLAGIFYFWRRGRQEGFPSDSLLDLTFLASLFGLLGGRVLFLALFREGWGLGDLFLFGEGVFWAGIILGGGLTLFIFSRLKGWSALRVAALASLALSLGQALGFLGAEAAKYLPFAFYPAFGYFFLWLTLRFLINRKVEPGYAVSLYLIASGGLIYLAEWLRPLKAVLESGWNLNYSTAGISALLGLVLLVFLVARKTLFRVKR